MEAQRREIPKNVLPKKQCSATSQEAGPSEVCFSYLPFQQKRRGKSKLDMLRLSLKEETPDSFHTGSVQRSPARLQGMQRCEGQHLRHRRYRILSAHPHTFPSSAFP